ncbi:MAG: SurA N-terminal domain-containing protein [Smithella sp.]
MKNKISKSCIAVFVLFVFVLVSGCSDNEKKNQASSVPAAGANQIQNSVSGLPASNVAPEVKAQQADTSDLVVSVDGKILKKSELEKNLKARMEMFKDKIPADKQKEVQENLRKQLVDAFVRRTLLSDEFARRKIEASSQDVKAVMDQITANLPPGKKLDDFLKENKISQDDILLEAKAYKFRKMEIGDKGKPTQKEIKEFYKANREKYFTDPKSGKKVTFDEAKGKISAYLEQQKNQQAFMAVLKNLQQKAKIIVY